MLFSYAFTRLRFARGFEANGDGFIYRARATAPAIPVSSAEREDLLREFRRQFWRHQFSLLGATFALILLLAVVDLLLVPVGATEAFVTYGAAAFLTVPVIAAVFLLDRRLFDMPMRRFPDRAPVAPPRTWWEAYYARARRRSWLSLILWTMVLVGFAWLFFPDPGAAWWALPAWSAYFGLAFVLLAYDAWLKYEFSRDRRD